MTMRFCFITAFTFICYISIGQARWPIPVYYEKYGVYHHFTNDVNLKDTTKVQIREDIYFRIVLFDSKGKSYFEAYKNNRLYEKGYFENSLDTLKKYSVSIGGLKDKKIKVFQYFHPIKDGVWFETISGRLIKRKYVMGVKW